MSVSNIGGWFSKLRMLQKFFFVGKFSDDLPAADDVVCDKGKFNVVVQLDSAVV